jgi:RNA recognition motif-containing protein
MDIYVGNLSFQLSESDLQDLFQEYGEVKSVKIITDKMTGKSKGFAFVSMANDEEATRAVEQLNNRQVSGRNLVVNQARPKTEDSGSGHSGGGYGGGGRSGGGGYGRDSRGGGGGYGRDSRGGGRDGGYKSNNNW